MIGRAVTVHYENPSKTLFAESGRQIHKDAAQGRAANRVAARINIFSGNLITAAVTERNAWEHEDGHSRARDNRFGKLLREPFVRITVGVRRQMWSMLFEYAAG